MDIAPGYKIALVREMRQTLTRSEAALWEQLRGRRVDGVKFRRQHPVGRFIPDFVCEELALIVEIDGSIHAEPEQIEKGLERLAFLQGYGYAILRLDATEVEKDMAKALQKIRHAVATARALPPKPQRETGMIVATGPPLPATKLPKRGEGQGVRAKADTGNTNVK